MSSKVNSLSIRCRYGVFSSSPSSRQRKFSTSSSQADRGEQSGQKDVFGISAFYTSLFSHYVQKCTTNTMRVKQIMQHLLNYYALSFTVVKI